MVWPSTTTDEAWVSFSLAPLTPPTPVAGIYTLTISADPGCTGLPGDVQTRSYQAAVTPNSSATLPANTSFNGQLTGARFAPYSGIFWIGVAADYVVVSSEGEGPSIVEDLGTTGTWRTSDGRRQPSVLRGSTRCQRRSSASSGTANTDWNRTVLRVQPGTRCGPRTVPIGE